MSSFQHQETLFFSNSSTQFSTIFIVDTQLPFGLAVKDGQVVLSPEGECLGWKYEDEETFRNGWHVSTTQRFKVPLTLWVKQDSHYRYSIRGSNHAKSIPEEMWTINFHWGGGCSEITAEFSKFSQVLAWLKDNLAGDHGTLKDLNWQNVKVFDDNA